MHPEILAQEGYVSVSAASAPVLELFPGIRRRPLWTGPDGEHAQVLEMDPGTSWPRRDIHQPGPEEVYVLTGTFSDGARDYPAGTFLHAPAGSWHVPATATGCALFVFYPAGLLGRACPPSLRLGTEPSCLARKSCHSEPEIFPDTDPQSSH